MAMPPRSSLGAFTQPSEGPATICRVYDSLGIAVGSYVLSVAEARPLRFVCAVTSKTNTGYRRKLTQAELRTRAMR